MVGFKGEGQRVQIGANAAALGGSRLSVRRRAGNTMRPDMA